MPPAHRVPPADGSTSARGRAPADGGWAAVLRGLDARRSTAFARADPDVLDEVYAAGSPALRRDRDQLATLVARGLRAEKVRLRTISVAVRRREGDGVVLRVGDVLEPFGLRSVDSGRVTRSPGRGARTWQVTLRHEGARWEVYDVSAA